MSHLLLIDGYNLVFRAFFSLPGLTRDDGVEVGATYGFASMLMRILSDTKASHATVIFDTGGKNFRHELYAEYKANRPPAPDNLIPQFKLVREVTEALNIPILEKDGYEADDLIATLCHTAKDAGFKVSIISVDKDLMQLISDEAQIHLYDPVKKRELDEAYVQGKFGVGPDKLLDCLALIGDSSDNVPGVTGIGPKTAAELINQYGSLESLLDNVAEIKQPKRRNTLTEQRDVALLSKQLITLDTQVALHTQLEDLIMAPPDPGKLGDYLRQQGFTSLISRAKQLYNRDPGALAVSQQLNQSNGIQPFKIHCQKVTDQAALAAFCDFSEAAIVYIMPFYQSEILQLYLAKAEQAIMVNIKLQEQSSLLDGENLPLDALEVICGAINSSPGTKFIGHNLKPLLRYPINSHNIDDLALMAYLLQPAADKYDFTAICQRYLGEGYDAAYKAVLHNGDDQQLGQLCAISHNLWQILQSKLCQTKMLQVYYSIEKPLLGVLCQMEQTGILLNKTYLVQLESEFQEELAAIAQKIHALAGHEFNIASPQQLGIVLFEEMGLSGATKNRKSGNYKTDAGVLTNLATEGHEIASLTLKWRQLAKLISTYTTSLIKLQHPLTQRLHTTFNMTATTTGRLSSVQPNLQNIPIRSVEAYKIRKAFIAPPDYQLLSADYSQIELRLLAEVADITVLKEAFARGDDIHAKTASDIFQVTPEQVDANMRRKAKAINFGIIYGISAFGLAVQLDISRQMAADYIEAYFKTYPGIKQYMDKAVHFALEHGYVKTLFGRYCYLPEIKSSNRLLAENAKRAAINAPLQGSAADIIKKAMIKLPHILAANSLSAKMILQVHDELLFEIPTAEAVTSAELIKHTMQEVVELSVPLIVDAKLGNSWDEIH